jgi:hypothetical protein
MTKQQLIEKVAAATELKKSEVEVAVDSLLPMIAEALQANERLDLRGFGTGAPSASPAFIRGVREGAGGSFARRMAETA